MKNIFAYIQKLEDLKDNELDIPILRIAKFKNTAYGDFEFTQKTLDEIATNFNNNAIGRDVIIDKEHNHENLGMVKRLFQKGKVLYAKAILNAEGIKQKSKYKYSSPEIWSKFVDKLSGKKVGEVIKFISFTNDPFQPLLPPIVALNDANKDDINFVVLNDKPKKEIDNMEKDVKVLQDKIIELEKVIANNDVEKLTDLHAVEIKKLNDSSLKLLTDKDNEIKKLSDELTNIRTETFNKQLSDYTTEAIENGKISKEYADENLKDIDEAQFNNIKSLVDKLPKNAMVQMDEVTSGTSTDKKLSEPEKIDKEVKKLVDADKREVAYHIKYRDAQANFLSKS